MTLLTPAPEQRAPDADAPRSVTRRPTTAADLPLRYLAAAASFGAAGIHFAVMPEHWLEWKAAGIFFGVLAWLQIAWSVALLMTRKRVVVELGLLLQLGTICTWVLSRTAGLPFGPEAGQAEPASFIDILSSALEGVCLVAGLLMLVPRISVLRLRSTVALGGAGLLIAGVVGATSASLIPSVGGHVHTAADGHTHAAVSGDIPPGWVSGCHSHPAATDSTATAGFTDPADIGHAPGNCTNAKVTGAQRAAAERLFADTSAVVNNRFPTLQSALSAGYIIANQTGPLVHVIDPAYGADGRMLDPQHVESLVYMSYGKLSMLLGAMYVAEPSQPQGPLIGGALTSWHVHTNLCVDPARGTALNPGPNGCAPGSSIAPTPQMLHVWTIPYQGGPYADISTPALITAVTAEFQRRATAGQHG